MNQRNELYMHYDVCLVHAGYICFIQSDGENYQTIKKNQYKTIQIQR